jgi:hypothetical protein
MKMNLNRTMYITPMKQAYIQTVQAPNKITAAKGKKQVAFIASSERGTLATLRVAVNATGNCLPPLFVFPRKKLSRPFSSRCTCRLYRGRK